MPNAVFVCHPVSSRARCCPPSALACHCCSTPLSSATIAIGGSCPNLPQSLLPICCLCRLLLLSLIAVVLRWWLPPFQFIVRHCCRHRFLSPHRRHFLPAVDIIAIYCPPSPHLLLPAQLLVSYRASSIHATVTSSWNNNLLGQIRRHWRPLSCFLLY